MINVVVEGESDRGMAEALVRAAGREVGKIVVKGGKSRLDPLVPNYNRAAGRASWLVMRDSDTECPVTLHARLTAKIDAMSPNFLLRVVHPMTEGWLLADPAGFAEYFSVRVSGIPRDPDSLMHPKQTVLGLCAKSLSSGMRKDMVAPGGRPGPLYVLRINEFASTHWNVIAASEVSDSLRRAVDRIRQLPIL